ncbi:MAG: outer membrane protein transport protein [Candidatus Binatus sp.]|uniref:OmpP1/FadL family transporter n=1 Tax=Candidatus Binatus sp. TaxID=2811406 RepID=UPI003BB014A8
MNDLRVFSRIRRTLCLATVILLALVTSARAAGLLLYETGAPDLGTASAGRAAMAGDASTAAANPAGMTQLDRSQLLTASGALLPFTNFDVASQTTTSGGGGGNAGVFSPIGGFFYVYRLSEKLRLGVALDSNFAFTGNYGKTWVGRYYVTYESILSGTVNPSVAYEVNDWLSVGAGVSFSVARLKFQSKVNNALPRAQDGGLAFESWDEAFGGNAGILLKPIAKLRIGLTYQSPEDYKFGFRPHLTNLGPILNRIRNRIGGSKINIPMEVPQQVMLSGLYEVTPYWSLMGNVGWQNWSAFGEFPVGISTAKQRTVEANLHFSDTCQIAIGQQLRIGEKWLWSAGFAYDSSTVSKNNRLPILPIDRQLRYGTGIQYQINKDITAGAAWEFMDAGPAPYSARRGPLAGTLQGHYSTNYLNFVGVNVIWKF